MSTPPPKHTLALNVFCDKHGANIQQPLDLMLVNLGNAPWASLAQEDWFLRKALTEKCGCSTESLRTSLEVIPWPEEWR